MSNKPKKASWVFVLGVVLAIFLGIITAIEPVNEILPWILIVLGILIGFLNITQKEAKNFMFAGAVLILVTYLSAERFDFYLVKFIPNILDSLLMLFVPAVMITAIREMWAMAENK